MNSIGHNPISTKNILGELKNNNTEPKAQNSKKGYVYRWKTVASHTCLKAIEKLFS